MSSILFFLAIFWTIVNLLRKKFRRKTASLLTRDNDPDRGKDRFKFCGLDVIVETARLSIHLPTDKLSILVEYFDDKLLLKQILKLLYDIGSIISVLGLFLSFSVLGVISYKYLFIFGSKGGSQIVHNEVSDMAGRLVRRSLDMASMNTPKTMDDTSFAITPIVGYCMIFGSYNFLIINLDTRDYCTMVSYTFTHINSSCGSIHSRIWTCYSCFPVSNLIIIFKLRYSYIKKMIRDSVPLTAAGLSLFFVIPVAFVGTCPKKTEALSPVAKLRVAGAGIWHNLLTWLVIYLFTQASVYVPWTILGWRDVQSIGLVVLEVEKVTVKKNYDTFLSRKY